MEKAIKAAIEMVLAYVAAMVSTSETGPASGYVERAIGNGVAPESVRAFLEGALENARTDLSLRLVLVSLNNNPELIPESEAAVSHQGGVKLDESGEALPYPRNFNVGLISTGGYAIGAKLSRSGAAMRFFEEHGLSKTWLLESASAAPLRNPVLSDDLIALIPGDESGAVQDRAALWAVAYCGAVREAALAETLSLHRTQAGLLHVWQSYETTMERGEKWTGGKADWSFTTVECAKARKPARASVKAKVAYSVGQVGSLGPVDLAQVGAAAAAAGAPSEETQTTTT